MLFPVLLTALLVAGCGSSSSSSSATGGSATGGSASPSSPEPSYGGLPSWLPSDAVQPDSILTGTAARPAVTSQGDQVKVELSGGSVVATVTGPAVPGQGLPYVAESTTCTFTVTLTGGTVAVPLAPAQFTAIDHLGHVFPLAFVAGQPTPPATLQPGARTTFELRTVMPTGEGLMRWAPAGKTVASWDFEVEND